MMTEYPDNFANYPESITHLKSDEDGNAAVWTPRDALIDALRLIDKGEVEVDSVVVAMRTKSGKGATSTFFRQSAPDVHTAFGLIEAVKYNIWNSGLEP